MQTEDGTGLSTISCAPETREMIKGLKRGGESYDTLLRKMASQYDPMENAAGNST